MLLVVIVQAISAELSDCGAWRDLLCDPMVCCFSTAMTSVISASPVPFQRMITIPERI
jgi:hypothetical protein